MSLDRASLKRIGLMVALLVGAALACNMPVAEETVPAPESPEASPNAGEPSEPAASPAQATLAAPQTVPASITTGEAEQENGGAAPTFTPIQPPTLAASLTPSVTPSRRPTNTPRPGVTSTSANAGGPLTFTYNITWRLKDASATVAIATVTFNVKGGSGVYTYFRDELQVDGPVFEYEWATCRGNPGSLRVDSSDGQSSRVEYFQNPPCPTATPTP
jgi:hypothetical protein